MENPSHLAPATLLVQLLTKHRSSLFAFICSIVPTRADAEDVLQETSLTIWQKWNTYDPDRDFLRWACGIAHMQVLRHRRRQAANRLWFDDQLLETLSQQMLANVGLLELRRDALDICLDRLNANDKEFIECRYRRELTVEETARHFSTTPRTVHRTMARIRRLLRFCISDAVQRWQGAPR